ncbi:MAG TPA: GNAT family N-acetyltransferase [Polyangiaceae bacterium]|jgi:predicted acetyltransferase|nr:GNAT family N-acetyltransferase [Polyangiaceae bacterium]
MQVLLTAVQDAKEALAFFVNTWPMYVREISRFDTDFYSLDDAGHWQPDLTGDWTAAVTPLANLREARSDGDPEQPFQRSFVISSDGSHVGFVCVGAAPFKYMPEDADFILAEFFVEQRHRGTGVAEAALQELLVRYPGRWFLRAIHDNTRAIRFWRRVLPRAAVHRLREQIEGTNVTLRFIAGRAP